MATDAMARCLAQVRTGGYVLLVDDAVEPPEAVVAFAASRVTPEAINFLVTHARGLVCLVLTPGRMRKLGIPLLGKTAGAAGAAYGASIEDSRHKLEYDLYYAKNYTPFLDLLIILQTLRVVLWHEGAR